ncbi:MAG: hypothetical protein ACO262_00300 [Vulcanococcus sp.]|jgi:hypothetical protein
MAASRLNDSQKQELVARYRQGETGQSLALAYGCSANTVSRVVRAALAPEELAALKKQARPRAGSVPVDPPAPPAASAIAAPEVESVVSEPEPAVAAQVVERDASGVLAIDDADDFGDDGLDEFGEDDIESGEAPGLPAPVSSAGQPAAVPVPLTPGALPGSVYLLVDKTVELEPRPLREFTELGSLPAEEQDRRALMLYANPRQAKRQCGRSQRVIKVPDSGLLQRRSSYLVAQGITRLVLEGGSLFAIPGC